MKRSNRNQSNFRLVKYFEFKYLSSLVLTVLCIAISTAQAQDKIMSTPLASLQFKYDGRVLIPLKINHSEKLDIIFDTGISQAKLMLLMHNETGRKLDLKIDKTVAGARGAGSGENRDIHISVNNEISLNALVIKNMSVAVMDQSIDSSLFHNKGVIGNALLLNHVVEIDFDSNKFNLYDAESFVPGMGWEEVSIEIERNLPIIKTTINIDGKKNIPLKLIIDTGGRGGLALVADPKKQLTKPEKTIYKLSGTGLRGAVYGDHSRIARTKFGTHIIKEEISSWFPISKVPILEELSSNGALGIDFLRRFNLIFDYRNKRILIKPNKNLNKNSEINMAGLSFVQLGSGQKIVYHVINNSQAFKKGIKKGDILTEVNGVDSKTLNLHDLNKIFSQNGDKVNLRYTREGQVYEARLKLKRIL